MPASDRASQPEMRILPACLHSFQLHGLKLAFDAGSGTLMVLDDAAWQALTRAGLAGSCAPSQATHAASGAYPRASEKETEEAEAELRELKARGLVLTPIALPLRRRPVLKALCLHVAHSCQMSCAYCFASGGDYGGDGGLMPLETARAAVDFLLGASPGVKRWAIDFFGGEPLLNWKVVCQTVLYAEKRAAALGGQIHFTLTTNGLALDGTRLGFLDQHGVDLVISVDGRREVHDAVRRTVKGEPTWERAVAAARLALSGRLPAEGGDPVPAVWVRGTYTRRNLDFARDALALFELGFPCVSLEPVCGGPPDLALRSEDLPVLFDQYEQLALACATAPGRARFYHFELSVNGGPCLSRRRAACGAGGEYLAVTPLGELYACHQLVGHPDFLVGDVWRGITRSEAGLRLWEHDLTANPRCTGCWARFLCGGGCRAAAYFEHGDVGRPPSLECALQRKRWECALWVQARRSL